MRIGWDDNVLHSFRMTSMFSGCNVRVPSASTTCAKKRIGTGRLTDSRPNPSPWIKMIGSDLAN